jgi:hypothetical protein
MKLRTRPMKEANLASSLMVNVESRPLSAAITSLGLRTGSFAMSAYGIETATSSVVTAGMSLGICSPVYSEAANSPLRSGEL